MSPAEQLLREILHDADTTLEAYRQGEMNKEDAENLFNQMIELGYTQKEAISCRFFLRSIHLTCIDKREVLQILNNAR